MKGVSLAIETIIVIILAVTTLTVLLFFFLGTGAPAQDRVLQETKKVDLCGKLVLEHSSCDEFSKFSELTQLKEVCNSVVPKCERPDTDKSDKEQELECIRTCCSFVCPPS